MPDNHSMQQSPPPLQSTASAEAAESSRQPVSRVDQAYQRIVRLIKDEKLVEGSRLPSEAALAESFKISRPVVRQAISRLKDAGVLDIRWGAGTYLKGPVAINVSPTFQISEIHSLEEVRYTFEVRRGIESEVAALAAERATAEGRERMRTAFLALQHAFQNGKPTQELDVEFHFSIAAAACNPIYEQLLLSVRTPIRRVAEISKLLLAEQHLPERVRAICSEHAAIMAAIDAHDPEAARQAMRVHVDNACRRVTVGV